MARKKGSGKAKTELMPSSLEVEEQLQATLNPTSSSLEIDERRRLLPIYKHRRELLKVVAENQVILVVGETGSGKTTQIPQYLLEHDYHLRGCIGCTQPWEIATTSAACRVCEEYGCEIGKEVGYAVRSDKCFSKKTIIKYMVDEILASECIDDPELKKYSVIMIDEAHTRAANTDLLLGMLKNATRKRADLKLIVCSAALDEEKFSAYFTEAAVFDIPGRLLPVEIIYTNTGRASSTKARMNEIVRELLLEIHETGTPGDVLVFLSWQKDIERLCGVFSKKLSTLSTRFGNMPIVLPLHESLEPHQHMEVFEKTPNNRKIILATSFAESSATVEGIVYVIDCGLEKQKTYEPEAGANAYKVRTISQAQAEQRARLAGRTAAGKCIRVYSEADFNNMSKWNEPEIMRCNLTSIILTLKCMGFKDIFDFPFIDPPPFNAVVAAIYQLTLCGDLKSDQSITEKGKRYQMTRRKKWGKLGAKSESFPEKTEEQRKLLLKPCANDIEERRKLLPIFGRKSELLELVANNKIVIVTGDTGSGKTTQIPQYLAEAGYAGRNRGRIGCTLPWRIAASSAAIRVSREYGCKVGKQVGYVVRFDSCVSKDTIIKYMTDGILVSECVNDRMLKRYSVIIIDEAHGRTANTDLLFGVLRNAVGKRKDLKLILCSATLDEDKFRAYFSDAPILDISGRLFPVEIAYTDYGITDGRSPSLTKILKQVIDIHRTDTAGDVLVFLPGQEDIERLCGMLSEKLSECQTFGPKPLVLPFYGALERQQQMKVFEKTPNNIRKIIVATNIAESSVTIEGIVYVIDSGLQKRSIYQPETGVESLKVCIISQAQAEQRAGRVGRTAPGRCIRMYSETIFNEMSRSNTSELLRCNLASPVLKLKSMGVKNIFDFPFMDAPPREAVAAAIYHLMLTGALENDQSITKLGKKISEFPVEPCLGKFLILSQEMGCLSDALTVVSLLSVLDQQKLYYKPMVRQELAAEKRSQFFQPQGDYHTLSKIYEEWNTCSRSFEWCIENFLSVHGLNDAQKIRQKLISAMSAREPLRADNTSDSHSDILQKAVCAAFFYNAAKRRNKPPDPKLKHEYVKLADGQIANINMGSSMFESQPDWIVYHEAIEKICTVMHEVAPIRPEWLVEVAPGFFSKGDDECDEIYPTNKFAELKKAAGVPEKQKPAKLPENEKGAKLPKERKNEKQKNIKKKMARQQRLESKKTRDK